MLNLELGNLVSGDRLNLRLVGLIVSGVRLNLRLRLEGKASELVKCNLKLVAKGLNNYASKVDEKRSKPNKTSSCEHINKSKAAFN